MENENSYYPWPGEFTPCSPENPVAVVLLRTEYAPKNVAIYGPLKTENIGIEKIVANVISNPNIRYLLLCGKDIRGHRSGSSLIALHKNGMDQNKKIIDAPGAIPYIENLAREAIERFQNQIEIVDLINETDEEKIDNAIQKCVENPPFPYGKPYIAVRVKPEPAIFGDKRALHSRIMIDYMGKVSKRR